jgi:PAS domain S-box-containing protein
LHEGTLLRTLVDNLPDYIYAKDRKSRFTLNNLAHARLLGGDSADPVSGKTDHDIFPKDLADIYFADEQEVMRKGNPLVNREETTVDQQGRKHWVLSTKVPLRDEAGNVIGIVGIGRDITCLKEAELALERRAELRSLEAIISSRFIGVPLSEMDEVTQCAMSEVGEFACVDRSFAILFREKDKESDFEYEWCSTGIASCIEQRRGIRDGKKLPWFAGQMTQRGVFTVPHVAKLPEEAAREKAFFQKQGVESILVVPIISEGTPVGYVGFEMAVTARDWDEDITALLESMSRILMHTFTNRMHMEALRDAQLELAELNRNLEERVVRRTAELEEANKELDQFTYVASHDLQEPLRKQQMFTEVLNETMKGELGEDAARALRAINSGAQRMQDLVQSLLSLSRARSRDLILQSCSLVRIVDQAISSLELRIRDSGASVTKGDLPEVYGDQVLLSQVFQNLIVNAILYRDRGVQPEVKVSGKARGGMCEIAVQDNGIGIHSDSREKIFEPFKRLHTRNEYEGTGIGLALCKKIVERHGGEIWVESNPDSGSTFRFTLRSDAEVNTNG